MADEQERTLSARDAKVGFPTALASAVGLIMASPVILTVTSGFGSGGWVFVVAIAIAFIVMQAQAMSFAEAAAILPTQGAVYDYLSCGLGRFCAITGTISAYLLVHVFAGTAETILSGVMALVNFPSLDSVLEQRHASWLVGVAMVVLFGITNALGIRVYSRIELVLTIGMWSTLTIFGIVGLLHPPVAALPTSASLFAYWFGSSSVGSNMPAVLSMLGLAMFMFVGFEFVTPLAPELSAPSRQIPRAMSLGLWAVASCMVIYGAAIRREVVNVPVNAAGTLHLLDTPSAIPHFAEHLMGAPGRVWLGVGLLFAGAATINTLMAGLPRILQGMAVDGALPRIFAYQHPRLKTPLVAIAVSVAIPCLHAWIIHGDVDRLSNLVLAAVCAWGVAYVLVTLSVVSLRLRRPDLPRPYRSPWFPAPQIVSIIGIVVALLYITPTGSSASAVYVPFGIMLGATALYALIWTRFIRRVPLFEPASVERVLQAESAPSPRNGAVSAATAS
jgi:amino acid transporter